MFGGVDFRRLPHRAPNLLPTPKALEGRKQAAAEWPFLWILSFGQTTESISPVGARTDIKMASQSAP